jgi:hypothetical protein
MHQLLKIAVNAIVGIVLYFLMFYRLSPTTDIFTFSIGNFFAAIFLVKAVFLGFPRTLTDPWAVQGGTGYIQKLRS